MKGMDILRHLFALFLLLQCSISAFAQEDRFHNVQETKGKEIFIIDNSALSVASTMVDGKVKPVQKIKNYNNSLAGKVYTVENDAYTFKKKDYIVLKNDGDIILLKEEDAPLYLSSFVSRTYWKDIYDQYRKDYTYLDFKKFNKVHSTLATTVYDDLSPIEWTGFVVAENGASFYMCELRESNHLDDFKVPSYFFEENKDRFFIKKDDIQPYIDKYNVRLAKEKRDKEIADSIANRKLRLAKALKEKGFSLNDLTTTVEIGDTLAVYSYNDSIGKYVARFRYANLPFDAEDIEFFDTQTITREGKYSWEKETKKYSPDAEFLKKKGKDGEEDRFLIAMEYDDAQTELYLKRLQVVIDAYHKDIADKKKNQIFITGIKYAYDSNEYSSQFGMRFDVYNCFSKTIKYVEFTLTNYNAVGDIQRDDFGRSSRTVKGIGPIEPQEGGTYEWDDIFWDDNGIIDKSRLTRVKFIFTDGSTRVFSGYANIAKHMTPDAWD